MGLFTQRPEEPTEWAGLPSEPISEVSPAELLPEPAPDLPGLGLGGGVSSIPLVVEVPLDSAADDEGAQAPR